MRSRPDLTAVAANQAVREVPAILDPGDAVFFGGHVLHRSHANRSATRSRRAFVAHYCNARSCVPWDDEPLQAGEMANGRHLLARGATHLPVAARRFTRRAMARRRDLDGSRRDPKRGFAPLSAQVPRDAPIEPESVNRLRRLVGDGSGPVYVHLHDGDLVAEAIRALALVRR